MRFAQVAGVLLSSVLSAVAGAQTPRPTAVATWVDPERLVVDADAGEWRASDDAPVAIERAEQLVKLGTREPREQWAGPSDASVKLWLGWNEVDLVLYGEVLDQLTDHDAAAWYHGDGLELFLDVGERGGSWGRDDFQLMLAPNCAERPWGFYPRAGQGPAGVQQSDGGFGGIEIAQRAFVGGYRFEARLPWRNFARFEPRVGASIGFNLALCDRDGLGLQESYGTWSGESDLARFADRRGDLILRAPERAAASALVAEDVGGFFQARSLLLLGLVALYAIALLTRRVWRVPRARRRGVAISAGVVALALLIALGARWFLRQESERARSELAEQWTRFEELVHSGALGNPEPAELATLAQALLSNQSIAPRPRASFVDLHPSDAGLLTRERTARRGVPFAAMRRGDGSNVVLAPGGELKLPVAALDADAVHLVTRIRDPRYERSGVEQVRVLEVEARLAGQPLPLKLEVRHRQDLHFEEDEHVDHPGLEPAFRASGGRLGRVHGDALLLELGGVQRFDELVIRHVGAPASYEVSIVAVGARVPAASTEPPRGFSATGDGNWQWVEARAGIEVEVGPVGRGPKSAASEQFARDLALGAEPVATVHMHQASAPSRVSRWDFLPAIAVAAVAPFLVALFAEWLAARRRIRGKLALGFAASSAVPLLALTVLLDASLRAEHEQRESERARVELVRAERELEREVALLTREAQRLLRITELQKKVRGVFPETSEELAQWWGEADGAIRLLDRTTADGRRVRVASGPGANQIPRARTLRSGFERPWGQLLVCGVAQTASGSEQPLSVTVARSPSLPDSTGALLRGPAATSGADSAPSVRLIGGGRDPAPTAAELSAPSASELRRPIHGPDSGELVGVLVATKRERGVPVLGDFALTELLLAAGITAVFTALLFAGILTAHIVGPIERLDRAVRAGASTEVAAEVDDEIGHLSAAIRSYSTEVAERVRQLETLQVAHSELARRLDAAQAREAVLGFFARNAGAQSAWILWRSEPGAELRAFGPGGRDLGVPDSAHLFVRAAQGGVVETWRAASGSAALDDFERMLMGSDVARVVCLPLVAGGEERGAVVLGCASDAERDDLAFLRAAAAQSAIVLENARLYGEAVRDSTTGFLSDPGFRQRVDDEIQRAQSEPGAGVLLLQLRLTGLPEDEALASARLREVAKRLRLAVRGLAVFGRAGSADLEVAIPWTVSQPNAEAVARRVVDRIASQPWPDGEAVTGLLVAHAAWPTDGPSALFVLGLLEERLAEAQTGIPAANLARLGSLVPADFVAASPLMIQLLDTLHRLAAQEITVLVTGETGVGKDRIAELIHAWSARAAGPLIHIHCPSLTGALIEDELFGHEKGAFTGAHTRRTGPFEFAAGGTVVLDEIGGLSPEGQVALLRLIESREVLPLGATRPIALDVRFVATSSRDLAREVERGSFRRDLFFRLNVAQVTVPPLRLRRQALPELVAAFLRRHNASADRPVTGVAPKVMDVLFEHGWPGNVRELENVLARAFILCAGGELEAEHVELDPPAIEVDIDASASIVLTERQERLLESLSQGRRISSGEYAELAGISPRTALRDLLDLASLGLVVREGQRRGTRFRRSQRPYALRSGR